MELVGYQKEALDFLEGKRAAALFYEPGLGKSVITLEHLRKLGNDALPALIVCPLSGVGVWRGEVEKFGYDFKVVDIIGTKPQRVKALAADGDLYVINYDGLRVMSEHLLRKDWAAVVLDESHRCKDSGTQQTCIATKLCHKAPHRYLLTGTPVTNSPEDIWSQFQAMVPGYLGNFYAFSARYIDYRKINVPIGHGKFREVRKAQKFKNLEELRQRLAAYSLRKTKKECLDLPDKIYKRINCHLTTEQKKHYWALRTVLATQLAEKEFKVANAAVLIQKLQQVCQGFVYDGATTQHFDSCKWNMLKDLLIDIGNESMIIFTWYKYDAEFLGKALKAAGYDVIEYDGKHADRVAQIAEFQNSTTPKIFLSNIEKAKESITLTKATAVLYYGNSWNYGSRVQSEDRAHRRGQKNTVVYYDFVVPGTVDEVVYKALQMKGDMADRITGDTKRLAQMICEQEG
jgi:SNF2 family DNA or RNA helicase